MGARRLAGRADPADEAGLPPELALVPAAVLPAGLLRQVAARAVVEGVSAERVLLAAGHLTADRYFRLLAAHVGLPFAERPLRPASDVTVAEVLRTGEMRLAANPQGWGSLIAPRDAHLRALLVAGGRSASGVAITTPDRLEALIRYQHRGAVVRQASHGLPDWNDALSARSGLTNQQLAGIALVVAVICLGAWLMPTLCLAVLSSVFYLGFLMHASLRLLAMAASATLRPAVA